MKFNNNNKSSLENLLASSTFIAAFSIFMMTSALFGISIAVLESELKICDTTV